MNTLNLELVTLDEVEAALKDSDGFIIGEHTAWAAAAASALVRALVLA